ncbi:hypothetical protein HMPREF1154_0775 [Capnocytophaga sp. CM59]|nr:hypothetical protein HMPREF1154_0775 [Capnocytophaga sp. CM59]
MSIEDMDFIRLSIVFLSDFGIPIFLLFFIIFLLYYKFDNL